MTRTIALAPGCPCGVGPEVTARALALTDDDDTRFTYHGPAALLVEGARRAGVDVTRDGDDVVIGRHRVPALRDDGAVPAPGRVDDRALALQRDGLLAAIAAVADGRAHALVTAPLRKKALISVDGGPYPGQTELVHARLKQDERPPLMAFEGGPFLLGLLTVHVALKDVSALITEEAVRHAVARLVDDVRAADATRAVRIAVLGVNPHAGEDGLLGDEEVRVMRPALAACRRDGVELLGPLPADGFFAHPPAVDAVLAAHHDQGLAPYKVLAAGVGVNVTLGLRAPRTSPDHGTADAIAGTGTADPRSMQAAIASARRRIRRNHPQG